jgi:hypothetical protein
MIDFTGATNTKAEAIEAATQAVSIARSQRKNHMNNPGGTFAVIYQIEEQGNEHYGCYDFRLTDGIGDLFPPVTAALGVVENSGDYKELSHPRRHAGNPNVPA